MKVAIFKSLLAMNLAFTGLSAQASSTQKLLSIDDLTRYLGEFLPLPQERLGLYLMHLRSNGLDPVTSLPFADEALLEAYESNQERGLRAALSFDPHVQFQDGNWRPWSEVANSATNTELNDIQAFSGELGVLILDRRFPLSKLVELTRQQVLSGDASLLETLAALKAYQISNLFSNTPNFSPQKKVERIRLAMTVYEHTAAEIANFGALNIVQDLAPQTAAIGYTRYNYSHSDIAQAKELSEELGLRGLGETLALVNTRDSSSYGKRGKQVASRLGVDACFGIANHADLAKKALMLASFIAQVESLRSFAQTWPAIVISAGRHRLAPDRIGAFESLQDWQEYLASKKESDLRLLAPWIKALDAQMKTATFFVNRS